MLFSVEKLIVEIVLYIGMVNCIGILVDVQVWVVEIVRLVLLVIQYVKWVFNDDGVIEEVWLVYKEFFDKVWGSQDVIEVQVVWMEKWLLKF